MSASLNFQQIAPANGLCHLLKCHKPRQLPLPLPLPFWFVIPAGNLLWLWLWLLLLLLGRPRLQPWHLRPNNDADFSP
jgi:hypothetical protein